jgi:hypothetical protein
VRVGRLPGGLLAPGPLLGARLPPLRRPLVLPRSPAGLRSRSVGQRVWVARRRFGRRAVRPGAGGGRGVRVLPARRGAPQRRSFDVARHVWRRGHSEQALHTACASPSLLSVMDVCRPAAGLLFPASQLSGLSGSLRVLLELLTSPVCLYRTAVCQRL